MFHAFFIIVISLEHQPRSALQHEFINCSHFFPRFNRIKNIKDNIHQIGIGLASNCSIVYIFLFTAPHKAHKERMYLRCTSTTKTAISLPFVSLIMSFTVAQKQRSPTKTSTQLNIKMIAFIRPAENEKRAGKNNIVIYISSYQLFKCIL